MPKLYNTQTRREETLPEGEMQNALLSGSHSYAAGERVNVKDESGEVVSVPAENLTAALQNGYELETPSQSAVREYVEDNKGMKGALKVGVGQFADELAFGLPELIFDRTQDPLEVAKKEALKKDHEFANTVGGIGGFAAGTVVGAPIYKLGSKAGEVAAKNVAERLLAKGGEEIGTRTAGRVAKDLVARMATSATKMGVENAVLSAPRAITETMLGDPEAAGETMLAGVGIGALFGAATPLAKDLARGSKEWAAAKLAKVGEGDNLSANLARKAAKVLTGVPEDAIKEYIENPERINQALPIESIKDDMDNAVFSYVDDLDKKKLSLDTARQELKDNYAGHLTGLKQKEVSNQVVDDLLGSLEDKKRVLGEMSDQADEALAASGLTFQTKDLVSFLDDVGKSLGVGKNRTLVSDEANTAAQRLFAQRERIAEGFGKEISAEDLRGILREVRKDIKWNQFAGEFNDTLNQARKTFSERISGVLKEQVPEYRQIMEQMAPLSEVLGEASKKFGTKERAIGALNTVQSKKGRVTDEILERYKNITGEDFLSKLDELKSAKETLAQSKLEDLSHTIFPEYSSKIKSLESELSKAQETYDAIRRITPARTQSIIRNQNFKAANIEDRRAIEALEKLTGKNYKQMIRDRYVLDSFAKESTNGSRKTLLGALLGSAVGGPLGPVIGGAVGASADIYGGVALKNFIDSQRNVSGILFAEKAMKRTAERIDRIPSILTRMSERMKAPASVISSGAVLRLMTGDGDKKESPEQRLENFTKKASIWANDPAKFSEKISEIVSPVSENGAPTIGGEFNRKMSDAFNYLWKELPRQNRPLNPFQKPRPFKPTVQDMNAFEQKAKVVFDPFSALDELENGTLTKHHTAALKVVYPKIYDMMRRKVHDAVMNGVKPLHYSQRIKLSMLLDEPLDSSMRPEALKTLQSTYLIPEETPTQGGPKVDLAAGYASESERLAAN